MRRIFLFVSLLVAMSAATSAQAQMQPSTPSSPGMAGGSSMASGAYTMHGRGLGLGAVTMLNGGGTSGALVTWGNGGGSFHVDGIAGLRRRPDETTSFGIGGRFWYHLHATSSADFSVGGGLGMYRYRSGGNNGDSHIDVTIEVGGQIRAFIVPNVALMADLGLGATFGDNDDILFGAQSWGGGEFIAGNLGIAYFFE
jgi:hypothetical protein